MAVFQYYAKNPAGENVKGTVDAPTIESATELLRDRKLIILELQEKSQQSILDKVRHLINSVSNKELTFFARQLSVLINATIPVVRSLRVLTRQTKNDYFRQVISEIAADVDGGAKLSQSMTKYPRVFDQFFIHMVRSGETTGRLDQVLDYLATQKEKDYALVSRVRGALIYPVFILAVMSVVGVLMMIYVVPKLSDILTQSGSKIPWTTATLLGTSYVFVHFWWLLLLIVIGGGLGLFLYIRTPHGHYVFDLVKIKLPIAGSIYQRIAMTRFSISLANLLASGVPLPASLEIVADVVNNAVYHELIKKTIQEVETGNSISSVFARSSVVPVIVSQMLSVGEETGKLDDILNKLGNFYSLEIDASLSALASLIEPIIIITLGAAAAIMVVGILSPIYNITNTIA